MTGHPTRPETLWPDIREAIEPEAAGKANVYPTTCPPTRWTRRGTASATPEAVARRGQARRGVAAVSAVVHAEAGEPRGAGAGAQAPRRACRCASSSARPLWLGKGTTSTARSVARRPRPRTRRASTAEGEQAADGRRRTRPTSPSCASTAAPTTRGRRGRRARPSGSSTSTTSAAQPVGQARRGARRRGPRGPRAVQQLLPGLRRPQRRGHDRAAAQTRTLSVPATSVFGRSGNSARVGVASKVMSSVSIASAARA